MSWKAQKPIAGPSVVVRFAALPGSDADGASGGDRPTAYRGPFPFREGVTAADFEADGILRTASATDNWVGKAGDSELQVFHNGFGWVMRFLAPSGDNRLVIGDDNRLRDMWAAFDRVTSRHVSLYPIVMVHGVAFHIAEARAVRALIGRVLWEGAVA